MEKSHKAVLSRVRCAEREAGEQQQQQQCYTKWKRESYFEFIFHSLLQRTGGRKSFSSSSSRACYLFNFPSIASE
jgi:hypothetical protein